MVICSYIQNLRPFVSCDPIVGQTTRPPYRLTRPQAPPCPLRPAAAPPEIHHMPRWLTQFCRIAGLGVAFNKLQNIWIAGTSRVAVLHNAGIPDARSAPAFFRPFLRRLGSISASSPYPTGTIFKQTKYLKE